MAEGREFIAETKLVDAVFFGGLLHLIVLFFRHLIENFARRAFQFQIDVIVSARDHLFTTLNEPTMSLACLFCLPGILTRIWSQLWVSHWNILSHYPATQTSIHSMRSGQVRRRGRARKDGVRSLPLSRRKIVNVSKINRREIDISLQIWRKDTWTRNGIDFHDEGISQSNSYDHIIIGHIRRDHRESFEAYREKKVFSERINNDSSEKAEGKTD